MTPLQKRYLALVRTRRAKGSPRNDGYFTNGRIWVITDGFIIICFLKQPRSAREQEAPQLLGKVRDLLAGQRIPVTHCTTRCINPNDCFEPVAHTQVFATTDRMEEIQATFSPRYVHEALGIAGADPRLWLTPTDPDTHALIVASAPFQPTNPLVVVMPLVRRTGIGPLPAWEDPSPDPPRCALEIG